MNLAAFILVLTASSGAHASTYWYQGKEITKGQAIVILASNPAATITKQDNLELNMDKGTLRVKRNLEPKTDNKQPTAPARGQ